MKSPKGRPEGRKPTVISIKEHQNILQAHVRQNDEFRQRLENHSHCVTEKEAEIKALKLQVLNLQQDLSEKEALVKHNRSFRESLLEVIRTDHASDIANSPEAAALRSDLLLSLVRGRLAESRTTREALERGKIIIENLREECRARHQEYHVLFTAYIANSAVMSDIGSTVMRIHNDLHSLKPTLGKE